MSFVLSARQGSSLLKQLSLCGEGYLRDCLWVRIGWCWSWLQGRARAPLEGRATARRDARAGGTSPLLDANARRASLAAFLARPSLLPPQASKANN